MAKSSSEKPSPATWTRETLPRAILIAGPEAALRDDALAAVRKASASENIVTLHGALSSGEAESLTPATVLDEACTRSMFAAEGELKLVIVRSADLLLAAHFRVFEENFDALPNDATIVFETTGFGKLKSTNFYKKLTAKNSVIECGALAGEYGDNSALEQEIDKRARALGLRLSHGALLGLIARSAKSLGVIEEELNKLALTLVPLSSGGRGVRGEGAQPVDVSEHDIEELCARTGTATPFQFVDALLDGDTRKALETLGALFDRGIVDIKKPGKVVTQEDAIIIIVLGALTYKLTLLQDIRAAMDSGKSEFTVFGEFKLFGRRQDDIRRSLRRHTDQSLRQAVEALFTAYLSMRRGGGTDPRAVMEELVFKCIAK